MDIDHFELVWAIHEDGYDTNLTKHKEYRPMEFGLFHTYTLNGDISAQSQYLLMENGTVICQTEGPFYNPEAYS